MAHGIAAVSVDTQVIETRLAEAAIGEVVPYAELSALIGRDVQREARYVLESARARLLRHSQLVFDAVLDVGMKRLNDSEKVALAKQGIQRIHNTARRYDKKLSAVEDFDALLPQERAQHQLGRSFYRLIGSITKSSVMKKLSSKMTGAPQALPSADTISALREWV